MNNTKLCHKSIDLLKSLIQTPSFSEEEDKTAELIENWLHSFNVETNRHKNNIWAVNKHFDPGKPSVLLNSHHDTVRPNKGYTNDPFVATVADGKIFGLGSNDAGGCLVSLMSLFVNFYDKPDLKYNLIFAAAAEEETMGEDGISSLLNILPHFDFALVGEPTDMNLAVAEKGLLVIDGYAGGISGHAAHDNTESAIYNAIEDINWLRNYDFPLISDNLGKVKISVTQIQAGEQHNVVPAECHFVVDVRVNDKYSNKEVFEIIAANCKSKMLARSLNLNSSSIQTDHPLVQAGIKLGRTTYGSPTLSDQTNLSCPSLKLGPGLSQNSHSADEFIELKKIEDGIDIYIKMFDDLLEYEK